MASVWLDTLSSVLRTEQISLDPEVLAKHSHDASTHPAVQPEVVIWPLTTEDVQQVMKVAFDQNVPVTVSGTRTGLEGNAIPVRGGIVLDMSRMSQLLEVKADDFQIRVQPGMIGTTLNEQLTHHKLYFPAFPASANIATIGGMIANNAGGMYAVKYGVVGNWVMALEVVMANGNLIKVGSRSIKSVAGFDLKSLLIGSEGTLGIITEATLKVIPQIPQRFLVKASFATIDTALAATLELLHAHTQPAAMELLDENSVRYVNSFKSLGWNPQPTILIELHGQGSSLLEMGANVKQICEKAGSGQVITAETAEEMDRIWEARKAVHPAIMAAFPGAGIVPGDVGLPLSKIPEFMTEVTTITAKYQVPAATFGHIGDGNFHFWLIYTKGDESSLDRAHQVAQELVSKALALGGTCTAEHGVGIGKRQYLAQEHADSLFLMKQVKILFDPKRILNPGKILS